MQSTPAQSRVLLAKNFVLQLTDERYRQLAHGLQTDAGKRWADGYKGVVAKREDVSGYQTHIMRRFILYGIPCNVFIFTLVATGADLSSFRVDTSSCKIP